MKQKLVIILAVGLLLFPLYNVSAGVGTTGAQFLKIIPSARAAGMGGAFGAVSDDVYALYFNPSGIAKLNSSQVSATYLRYFGDVNYGFVGYATSESKLGAVGVGVTYLIVDKIERRGVEENSYYYEPEGYFTAEDQALTLAYAKQNPFPKILDGMDLGASLKFIKSEIDQNVAWTLSLDIAGIYSPMENLKTAVVIQNISYGIRFDQQTDPLPLNIKFAVSYKPINKLLLVCDLDEYVIDTKFYGSVGVEYWVVDMLGVRCGYKYGYDTASLGSIVGLTAGLGFRIWNLGVDYAYVPFGELGDTHRVSITFKF